MPSPRSAAATRLRNWLLAASALSALSFQAAPALSRDRPGTPTDVTARSWRPKGKLPLLLVEYRNTATEEVRFWLEWTINGEPQDLDFYKPDGPRIDCLHSPDNYYCAATHVTNARFGGYSDAREHPWRFYLRELAFDTDYCFRLRAQDDDGVISEIWSAWACARTPAAPPKPTEPAIESLTVMPGNSGRGEIGGEQPDRVLVEWSVARDQEINGFRVEGGKGSLFKGDTPPLESVVEVEELPTFEKPQRFRVCATNVVGETCSAWAQTDTYAADARKGGDLVERPVERADTRAGGEVVEAPQAPPLPEPAPTPPAEGRRRGPWEQQ